MGYNFFKDRMNTKKGNVIARYIMALCGTSVFIDSLYRDFQRSTLAGRIRQFLGIEPYYDQRTYNLWLRTEEGKFVRKVADQYGMSKTERLLNKMKTEQPDMYDTLVFWWNPKYQELTTEDIAENHTLKDLSGNGLDMTIVGSPVIAESGLLKFAKKDHPNGDGLKVDNFTKLADLHILDGEGPWSIIWSGLYDKEDIDSTQVRLFQFTGNLYVTTQVDATAGFRCYCRRGTQGAWRNVTDDYINFVCMTSGTGVNDGLLILNDNIQTGITATEGATVQKFVSGLFSTSNSASYDSLFESMILFKRQLTEEEVQWIKDNMTEKPAPPVPPAPVGIGEMVIGESFIVG